MSEDFWQGLADKFGTFDWPALHRDMPVFPRVAVRVLGWLNINTLAPKL